MPTVLATASLHKLTWNHYLGEHTTTKVLLGFVLNEGNLKP